MIRGTTRIMPKQIYEQQIFNAAWNQVKRNFKLSIQPVMRKNALESLWQYFNRDTKTTNQRLLSIIQNPTNLQQAISRAAQFILKMSTDVIN